MSSRLKTWAFDSGRNLAMFLAGAVLVILLASVVVMYVRINQMNNALEARENAPAAEPFPMATSQVYPDVDPLTDSTPPADLPQAAPSYPDAGDPLPVALDAVDFWKMRNYEKLEGVVQPGAYEDLADHPAPSDFSVNGEAKVTESGPTASTVVVPSTKGDVIVDLVVTDDTWVVTSLGWQ